MGRSMKCIAVLLALWISLIPALSATAVWFRQQYVRTLIHRQAESMAAETLCLPAAAYPGLSKGDEIYLGNKKYDIKEVSVSGDKLWVKAIDDKLEKALESGMKNGQQEGNGKKNLKWGQQDWINGHGLPFEFPEYIAAFFNTYHSRILEMPLNAPFLPPES